MSNENMIYAPFIGVVPTAKYASEVAALPYDVLSSAEAKVKVQGKPYSFLHISKAEIDFAGDVLPYEDSDHLKAVENFNYKHYMTSSKNSAASATQSGHSRRTFLVSIPLRSLH